MRIIEIVRKYMVDNGFTGLFNPHVECACALEDLAPCGEELTDCEAGYKTACTPDCDHGFESKEGNWHVQREKPSETKG